MVTGAAFTLPSLIKMLAVRAVLGTITSIVRDVISIAARAALVSFVRLFFFQAEDGIRDYKVTGVQTCALPILRDQIGGGADWIKVYADYRWGPNGEARPTFTLDELKLIVEVARSSGRPVVAHASTAEGMRRSILAGVETIDHGDAGTPEIFRLMKEHNVALCPTVAAGDALLRYRGWKAGDPEPPRITEKRASLRAALAA